MAEHRKSFESLYKENYRLVFSFFNKKGLSPEEANDLVQDVFLKALRGYESFQHKSKISTWLFQIAVNEWRNLVRHQKAKKRDAAMVSMDISDEKMISIWI